MLRRSLALLSTAGALLAGCGARSTLDVGAGAAPPPAPACPAALEPGAPSPMLGDCSTRTYRSSASGPTAPHVAWSASLGQEPYIPTLAVDAAGRAYVAQESAMDPSTLEILGVDAPGTVAWTATFDGSEAGTPILGKDGNLRLVHLTGQSQPELIVLSPGGATVATIPLPNDSDTVAPLDSLDPAVGADGSLYVSLSEGPGGSGRVARVSADGAPAWRSEVYTEAAVGVALGPGDRPYVLAWPVTVPETGVLLALDPATGATLWSRTLPGQPTGGPAIRSDGRVVVLTGDDMSNGVVWVLSPEDGSTVWSASTGVPTGVWLGLAADDTAVVISGGDSNRTSTSLTAVDAAGQVRWQQTVMGQPYPSGALDASGLFFVTSGDTLAIDVATGAVRWSLSGPSQSCQWPPALAPGGLAYSMQCDGTLFAAGD